MRKIFKIAITLLKGGGAFSTKKRSKTKWVLPAVLGLSFAVFAASIIALTMEVYDILDAGDAADVLVPIAFGATSVVIFVFGIFYVISTMYHADDIEMLMALPLRPFHILGGKFVTLVVYEYIMEAFILIPILVGYGVKSGAGVPYIIYSILLFIIAPIIALSMAAVIVMIVMRFTSFGKNKQAFKFVGGLIALLIGIGINVLIQSGAAGMTEEQLIAIATGQSSLVAVVSSIFPGIIFAANTLIFSGSLAGLGNFALFVLSSCGAAAVFLGVGQLVYFRGVVGVTETSAKRRELAGEALSKRVRAGSAVVSYIKKEMRLLVRSPIAFLNCVLMNFLWPVVLIAVLIGRGGTMGAFTQIIQSADSAVVIAIIVAFGAFVSSTNAVTSTAISREGKALYFTKYIPMKLGKQLYAKIATGMIISAVGIVLLIIVVAVIGLEVWLALIALVLSLLVMSTVTVAGLLIDVAHPKLSWMNEQQAIKQNVNVVLHILAGLVLAAVAVLPVLFARMSLAISIIYIATVFAVLLILLMRGVNGYAVKKLGNMDA